MGALGAVSFFCMVTAGALRHCGKAPARRRPIGVKLMEEPLFLSLAIRLRTVSTLQRSGYKMRGSGRANRFALAVSGNRERRCFGRLIAKGAMLRCLGFESSSTNGPMIEPSELAQTHKLPHCAQRPGTWSCFRTAMFSKQV